MTTKGKGGGEKSRGPTLETERPGTRKNKKVTDSKNDNAIF